MCGLSHSIKKTIIRSEASIPLDVIPAEGMLVLFYSEEGFIYAKDKKNNN